MIAATESDALALMREAVLRLNEAADAYYNGRGEKMSDYEWDALFDRVKAWEAETGVVLPDSPTNRVSADDVAGRKESHEYAALSLAKTKRPADVAKWAEGRPVWISWKLDGLTLVATYDGGVLRRVVTRGDGHVGTNITHLAAGIRGIPPRVADTGHLVVRGEAVISYVDFEAFRLTSGEDFANPRNLASGSLTLKDVDQLKSRKLQWIPFTLVHADADLPTWGARMDRLAALGFETVARERIDTPDVLHIQSAIDRWTRQVTDGTNPFPVDGLVVAYDDAAYAETGSVTGHHATRAGLAFKWPDEAVSTTLERIEWSCAVGSISPVAVFKPVSLEGTVVRRANLCNVSECERLCIGDAGTVLKVIKANKIIPKVIAVTTAEGALSIPTACPVCGARTEIATSPTGTRTLRCTAADCPAKALAKYARFVSKQGMDIDGLAAETLARFVNCGWIRSAADIYRLSDHAAEIAALEGFGVKSAGNICAALENARERRAENVLVALSIPTCGQDVARRLAAAYRFADLVRTAEEATDDAVFSRLDGIGEVKSAAIVAWFREPVNRALVHDLLSQVRVTDSAGTEVGDRCAGLTFVITGDVRHYANREAFKAYVLGQGGRVAGSVSAKTSFLVNSDRDSPSGKNRKAQALGIPIISEDDFLARFG